MVQWIEARRSLSFRAALSAHALLGRASDDLLHDAADLRKRSAGRDARAASAASRRPVPATPRARSPPELPGSRPRALPPVTAVGDYSAFHCPVRTWRSAADADVLPAPGSSAAHTVTRSWLYLTASTLYLTASTPPRTALHKSQPCRSGWQTKPGEAAPSVVREVRRGNNALPQQWASRQPVESHSQCFFDNRSDCG